MSIRNLHTKQQTVGIPAIVISASFAILSLQDALDLREKMIHVLRGSASVMTPLKAANRLRALNDRSVHSRAEERHFCVAIDRSYR